MKQKRMRAQQARFKKPSPIFFPFNKQKKQKLPKELEPALSSSEVLLSAESQDFMKEEEKEIEQKEEEAYTGAFSLSIQLNKEQLLAKELAFSGKSFCLVGAAGTGKTTAQREIAASLLESGTLRTHTFRVQGTKDY